MTDDGEIERLLRFLYLCPVGLADHAANGDVRMMNALAVQMLMPLASDGHIDNLFTVLAESVPDLSTLVQGYGPPFGTIVQDRQFSVRGEPEPRHYALSILRIGGDTFMATLSDVTQAVLNEEIARTALRAQAVQEGRVEILTGILHDIGNGITGMGTRTAILGAAPPWEELPQLEKLGPFLRQQPAALEAGLGVDRAAALLSFVDAVVIRLQQRAAEWRETVALFSKSILHVQEILNIQRQFIQGGTLPRGVLLPGELLEDALAIQRGSLHKRGIEVTTEVDPDLGPLEVDRTRLIQVLVNVLRNVAEAFDVNGSKADRRTLHVVVRRIRPDHLEFVFADNACGFDVPGGVFAITRGKTTKQTGSGLGLSTCAQIVASHHGTFTLRSAGRGQGATCSVVLPVSSSPGDEASP
ncbi:MAG TPA: HAMP domain-containing sensor histidine kinase [Chthoniobacterales bacterium]